MSGRGVTIKDSAARRSKEGQPSVGRKQSMAPKDFGRKQSVAPNARRKSMRPSKEEAKWQVEQKWAPPRPLTELELQSARKLFFQLDTDGSGSIDEAELGVMMRQLGQNPTDAELKEASPQSLEPPPIPSA